MASLIGPDSGPENSGATHARANRTGGTSTAAWAFLAAVVLLAGGWQAANWRADISDHQMRKSLLTRVTAIAQTIDPDRVKALAFTAADKDNAEFRRFCEQMVAYQPVARCRGIYTLAPRNGELIFGPESYAEDDPEASPPGTAYEQPTEQARSIFQTGGAFVEGPYTDEYGMFVSAFAPVVDPRTGEVLMAVGLDIEATDWQAALARERGIASLCTLALAVILLGGVLVLRRRRRLTVERQGRLRYAEAYLMAACGAALTLIAALVFHDSETRSRRDMFAQLAKTEAGRLGARFQDFRDDQLGGVARFYEGSKEVDRNEFRVFATPIIRCGSLQALAWVAAVPAAEKDALEAKARTEGLADFIIWQRGADGRREPAAGRDVYYPVWDVEPLADNSTALGYDLGSDPVRCAALGAALQTGLPTATDPVVLVLAEGQQVGMLAFQPVFSGDAPARILRGFALAVLRPESLLQSALFPNQADDAPTVVDLHLLTPGQASRLLASSSPREAQQHAAGSTDDEVIHLGQGDLSAVYPLFVFGKSYAMGVHPGPAFLTTHPARAGWTAALVGLLLTVLLTVFTAFLTRRWVYVEAQVQSRTAELRARAREQAAAEEALRTERENLKAIFAASPVGMLLLDAETMIVDANAAIASMVLRDPAQIIHQRGGGGLGCIHSLENEKGCGFARACPGCPLRRAILQVLASGTSVRGAEIQATLLIRGEEIRPWLRVSAEPVLLNGRRHAVVAVDDITDRKLAEEELIATNRELNEATTCANQMAAVATVASATKSEFLANMSHEIRTPLTAILGYADLVADSLECCTECPVYSTCETRNANRQHMQTIRRNGEHLLGLINDILDLSKIESGKLAVEAVPCAPVQLVADVQSLMRVRADAKGLPLEIEFLGPIPETITTDPTRMRQILVNLIGNAVKFTETGRVRLVTRLVTVKTPPSRAAMHGAAASGFVPDTVPNALTHNAALQFEVIDTGIGMTPEQITRIFKPFLQADSSTTRRFGGSGLGLAISKRLAEALGGTITVASQSGAGSTFTVTVATGSLEGVRMLDHLAEALSVKPRTANGPQPADLMLDCRILLAEDGPDNQRLIAHLLKKAGAEVTVVNDGQLAVTAALTARDHGAPFDVILMDMQMPVRDGYEATRLLREKGYTGPIVALTAHAMDGDRAKCLAAGCNDYAGKPIDRKELMQTIRAQLDRAALPMKQRTGSDALVSEVASNPSRGAHPRRGLSDCD